MVSALVLLGVAGTGIAQPAPATWRVSIGGETPDHAVQAQDFFPRAITIHAGDTITWTKTTLLPHTVHFLSGAPYPEDVIPQKDGRLLFNPEVAFPHGGKSYDGTGIAASGFLPEQMGLQYSLTFTKPGSYTYVCAIHQGMSGTVVVLPKGAKLPSTQARYDAAAAKTLADELAQGRAALAKLRATVTTGASGTVSRLTLSGVPSAHISFMRFGPATITVKVGDTVQWDMKDVFEIHSVTFPGAAQMPAFITPEPQPQGPPEIFFNPKVTRPAAGPHTGGYYNSGILLPPPAPMGPHTYSLKFTKAGTYTYWCAVHVPEGMRGTVIVQ
jgi:plastocyanin